MARPAPGSRALGAVGAAPARLRKPGDGDCGICFEYAVHDAVTRREPMVLDRVESVLSRNCRIPGAEPGSILFGVEKAGTQQLIETAKELLTPESLLMSGTRGAPVRLKKHIDAIASAFRRGAKVELPQSIGGLGRRTCSSARRTRIDGWGPP